MKQLQLACTHMVRIPARGGRGGKRWSIIHIRHDEHLGLVGCLWVQGPPLEAVWTRFPQAQKLSQNNSHAVTPTTAGEALRGHVCIKKLLSSS